MLSNFSSDIQLRNSKVRISPGFFLLLPALREGASVISDLIFKNYRKLFDINHREILFDPPPREMEIKTKINKWDLMKPKSFCKAKKP